MSYVNLIIHIVWSTKNRKKFLDEEKKNIICAHIKEHAILKNVHIININGASDHLHCLISISPSQNLSTIVQMLKGESSFWINHNYKFIDKFEWQEEYFAVSVSESHKDKVIKYIDRQEEHHKTRTFQDEYDEFIKNYKFENNNF